MVEAKLKREERRIFLSEEETRTRPLWVFLHRGKSLLTKKAKVPFGH
jgi:hypothetical protein